MAAIIETAIHDLQLPPSPLRENAHRWIASGINGKVTFNDACGFLKLEPALVRKRALAGLAQMSGRYLRGKRGRVG